ncbi:MAG: N-6 DNA methylase [Terrimicrobiaceae bacterium]
MSSSPLKVEIKDGRIFCPLVKKKNQWLLHKPEEGVRQRVVCRLVNEYGYSLDQMSQELPVVKGQRGNGRSRADIGIWPNKDDREANKRNLVLVVECKAETVKIVPDDYYQGLNYAAWANANFFVTTNEKETRYFRVNKETLPNRLEEQDEILEIPKAADLADARKLADLLTRTKTFSRDEFQKLLFRCHDVLRDNDAIMNADAFDEISKVLFMKIRHERKAGTSVFTEARFKDLRKADADMRSEKARRDKPFYQHLFDQTKEEFEDALIFAANDSLRMGESSFLQIVRLLEKYNLSDTSDDVKGIAFEEFLGKTFRDGLGQFFTPRVLVDFMVHVLDPQEGELVCDPCCGTGGFLIKVFEHVRARIERDIQSAKDRCKATILGKDFDKVDESEQAARSERVQRAFSQLNQDLQPTNQAGRFYDLSSRRIYGTDKEARSARTAKMNMIMHGDGHVGVHQHEGLLDVNGIRRGLFDLILTNPPFGQTLRRTLKVSESQPSFAGKDIADTELLDLYELGAKSTKIQHIFLERCLDLLKPGGRMGIVLPEGFFNNPDEQEIRNWAEGRARVCLIVSIPPEVFASTGATVKTSLLFLCKFTGDEKEEWEKQSAKARAQAEARHADEKAILLAERDALKTDKLPTQKKALADERSGRAARRREIDALLKKLDVTIATETRAAVKQSFDYEVPVAQVALAGLTATGGACENHLPPLADEFAAYRTAKHLWDTPAAIRFDYSLAKDGQTIQRRQSPAA